jgi:hypothetical protein
LALHRFRQALFSGADRIDAADPVVPAQYGFALSPSQCAVL